MIGLVVSNAKSAEPSSILYPRFNMAVPAMVLRRPIVDFMQSGGLLDLCIGRFSVGKVWTYVRLFVNLRSGFYSEHYK